ncbi:hypothetical protein IC608_01135 [Devosia sp. PTR5]|uniref:Uncharacterized protein n=1 Tax=Devosia oryzisoli TaxID=2774138 RepID=A0A927FRZ4_9HYPH|nr:hypothetical protein [Devosia oryzisoli]MBD8064079.1 hypothetical protein [Devosia oryzisoli]
MIVCITAKKTAGTASPLGSLEATTSAAAMLSSFLLTVKEGDLLVRVVGKQPRGQTDQITRQAHAKHRRRGDDEGVTSVAECRPGIGPHVEQQEQVTDPISITASDVRSS